jgi:RNA polymerase sigma-70 factor (ECF subfamily)
MAHVSRFAGLARPSLVPPRPRRVEVLDLAPADEELVCRARGGDGWASEALYRRHVAGVMRLATLLLRRRADAEDAVQDAFVIALTRLDSLREPAAFGAWVARIAANCARDQLRRRRVLGWFGIDRRDDDAGLEQLAAADASPEQRAELALLDRALAAMPHGERVAWTLRFVEGWPLAEIAEALGVSLATTKRRLAAAQEKLP